MEAFDLQMLGTAELAARWGVARQRIFQLSAHPKLGRPNQLACGKVWLLSQVVNFEDWVVANGYPVAITIPTEE